MKAELLFGGIALICGGALSWVYLFNASSPYSILAMGLGGFVLVMAGLLLTIAAEPLSELDTSDVVKIKKKLGGWKK